MLRWVILLVGLHSIHAVSVLASNHVNNICSMWGNFHFKTFDGDFYQFPGMCEYKLVYDYNEFSPLFSVHVKRMERTKKSEIPKISRVRVTINSFEFTLTKSQVMVNGKNASLPVYESGILVEKNTIYIRLYYKMGITVMWNKEDAVMVELDSKYSNSTQGLCGDFNGIRNEFGTVLDEISNRGCIPVQKCQCKHDRSYSPGEVLLKYNEKCICKEGNWICRSIPSPGLCSVEEGSHFTTFDGKEFTFHGACNYVLSKDCEESKFSIFGHIVPCFTKDADTCLKSIGIWFDNNKNHPLIIKADGTVQHDTKVSLPYNTADFTVFMPSSFHIMLQTTFGLQVQVQLVPLMQVYITVDKRFQGKTCGICGNFNKVVLDDLMTPQGVVEGTPVSFANAWKAQSNCPDRTERMVEPCSYRSDSERFATEWCSKMINKESLFANCHAVVNPDSYYKV
ncbi:mucin-2-like protein [Labeo rohita]|uniref:Mucin-2-like protein n=1 Tax=Labeo rohita TaxID=84645 RepID=A0A498MT20_LABRO|nr:mucin-2-like protein [Labeo rohita]